MIYDMEGNLWYIVSFENVVEPACVSMFPFLFEKSDSKKTKTRLHSENYVCILLKYYVICLHVHQKGRERSHYQENSRPG